MDYSFVYDYIFQDEYAPTLYTAIITYKEKTHYCCFFLGTNDEFIHVIIRKQDYIPLIFGETIKLCSDTNQFHPQGIEEFWFPYGGFNEWDMEPYRALEYKQLFDELLKQGWKCIDQPDTNFMNDTFDF